MKRKTNIEIAEMLTKKHIDFNTEGFSEYMNGYFNGIIVGIEYIKHSDKNKKKNETTK